MKQEVKQKQEEEEDVICIKEEPEEEQEVTATLLHDCQVQQGQLPESEVNLDLIIKCKNTRNVLGFVDSVGQIKHIMSICPSTYVSSSTETLTLYSFF